MADYVLTAETGYLKIQGGDVTFTVNRISDAVKGESGIPPEARKEVTEFIRDFLESLPEDVTRVAIDIPSALLEYADLIVEIIRLFLVP